MHTEEFHHNGRDYEVRVICDGETIFAKAFLDGRPANKIRCSAALETTTDLKQMHDLDVTKLLIRYAKESVTDA